MSCRRKARRRDCRARGPASPPAVRSSPFQQPERGVLEHYVVVLRDDFVQEPHEAALTFRRGAVLGYLAFDVHRVADVRWPLDVEPGIEESEAGVLHRGQQQALGEGIHERAGNELLLFLDGEKLLGEPGERHERDQVRFADGAAVRAKARAEPQVLERKAAPDGSYFFWNSLLAFSNAACMLLNAASAPCIMSFQASAEAFCSRCTSFIAVSRRVRNCAS